MKNPHSLSPKKHKLHFKLAFSLSLLVVIPCLLLSSAGILFFNQGIKIWFHEKLQQGLESSQDICKSYIQDYEKRVIETAYAIKDHIYEKVYMHEKIYNFFSHIRHTVDKKSYDYADYFSEHLNIVKFYFQDLLKEQHWSGVRSVIFSIPFEADHHADKISNIAILSTSTHPYEKLESTYHNFILGKKQDIFVERNDYEKDVRVILPVFGHLIPWCEIYLMVAQKMDPKVLEKIHHIEKNMDDYAFFLQQQKSLTNQYILIFIIFLVFFLAVAIVIGILFSRRMMHPISALIRASQNLHDGKKHHTILYESMPATDELRLLMDTFNHMGQEVAAQHAALEKANTILNQRKIFVEAVLKGVSSGVISLNKKGKILLINTRAEEILSQGKIKKGSYIAKVIPEFYSFILNAENAPLLQTQEIQITHLNRVRTVRVHINTSPTIDNIILTFDDVSTLIMAQQKNAWSDVAKRIAHEVKNPLTPIMLSAQRLKRRYSKRITTDPEIFQECIETIIAHVAQIGQLIEEFSQFARLPLPVFQAVDLYDMLKRLVTFEQEAYPDIEFSFTGSSLMTWCDPVQIERVFINVFKNAIESIHEAERKGKIAITLSQHNDYITIGVLDNGVGLKEDMIDFKRPYSTTKSYGTGLGLAIVQKIMYDHEGEFFLTSQKQGAMAILSLKLRRENPQPPSPITSNLW